MNAELAIVEAKRRWGPDAGICNGTGARKCQVGAPVAGYFQILGQGRTWREAFEDADARAASQGSYLVRKAG